LPRSRLTPPPDELVVRHYARPVLVQVLDDLLKLLGGEWLAEVDRDTLKLGDVDRARPVLVVVVEGLAQLILLLGGEVARLR
jgi:hypothetical protein